MGIRGLDALGSSLADRIAKSRQGAAAGMFQAANRIITEAKQLAPVETGALRGSGYVTLPEDDFSTIRVRLGFGGPASAYASVQERHDEYHHDVGQAHYLGDAIEHNKAAIIPIIREAVRASMEGSPPAVAGEHPTSAGEFEAHHQRQGRARDAHGRWI